MGTCARTNGSRRSSAGWRILWTRLRRRDPSAPSGSRADVWRVKPERWFTEAAGSPGPPTGQALLVAGVTLRISPEPLRNNADCERLACPTERLRGESETTAVHRFTSGTDEAAPSAATRENSSRAPCAFWKLPGPGRPPAPRPRSGPIWPWLRESFARPHRHQTRTQVTQPVMRPTEARPRFSSSRDLQRTTPPYSSNRNGSISFFI